MSINDLLNQAMKYRDIGIEEDEILYLNAAKALASVILNEDSQNITALLIRSLVFGDLKKPTEALQDLDLLVKLDPNNPAVHNNRAISLEKSGDIFEAVKAYEESIRLEPNIITYTNLARIIQKQDELQARELYDKAVELDSGESAEKSFEKGRLLR